MKPLEGSVQLSRQDRQVWLERLIPWALWGAAVLLLTLNLGGVPLRDWDEGTVAQVAREIWRSHLSSEGSLTWLFPTLWGEPYFNKPPLVHNLMAIAFSLGGLNEWTARLPSALLTASSVPLLYAVGREIFVRQSAAILSACVYLTLLPVVRLGRLAMLEGAVLFFVLGMVWCLLRSRRDTRYALGVGLMLAGVSLTKGVMLGGLFGAIALLFLAWDTPRLLTQPYLWLGFSLGSLPVVGWYGAQLWHYGIAFWHENLVEQSLQRIGNAVENNSGPPWYYLLEVLKYSWPWLLFLPLALRNAWNNRGLGWAKLVLVWGGGYFLIVSVMVTKLPWYILPIYPALALALGVQLADLWGRGLHVGRCQLHISRFSSGWGWSLLVLAGLAAAAGAYLAFGQEPGDLRSATVVWFLGVTFFATAMLVWRQNPRFIVVLLWGTYLGLGLFFLSPHWVWELGEDYPVRPVADLVRRETPAGEKLYTSDRHRRPSLEFYSDRPILPAPTDRLQVLWQNAADIYLLLDAETLPTWRSRQPEILGKAEGWTLVHKVQDTPFPPSAEPETPANPAPTEPEAPAPSPPTPSQPLDPQVVHLPRPVSSP